MYTYEGFASPDQPPIRRRLTARIRTAQEPVTSPGPGRCDAQAGPDGAQDAMAPLITRRDWEWT